MSKNHEPTSANAFKTSSEMLFAEYLGDRHKWGYEPAIGETQPDFLVGESVVCEITAIEADHLPMRSGAANPVAPIRNKIFDKWPQSDAARAAKIAFVLVLHQQGFRTDLTKDTIAAACFGNISIRMGFDPEKATLTPAGGFEFGEHGRTEPDGNRGLSAVAILRSFNPTLATRQREWATIRDRLDPFPSTEQNLRRDLELGTELDEKLMAEGLYDPDATAPRLLIVHTRKPKFPLPVGFLAGEFDEEWAIDGETGELQLVHTGDSFDSVPKS